jgi:glutathione S-transferase
VWLEYPDIEPTLRDLGAAPTFLENPSPRKWFYTIPVIVDPGHLTPTGDPTVVCDSWAIAEYLDEVYPDQNILFPPAKPCKRSLLTTLQSI